MTYKVTIVVDAIVGDGSETPDEVTSAIAGFFRGRLDRDLICHQYEDGRSTICNGRVELREISMVSARPLIQ